MRLSAKRLRTKDETGKGMHRLIKRYDQDLDFIQVKRGGKYVPLSQLPMQEFFDEVRKMPYRRDVKPIEVIARPSIIVRQRRKGIDCKKKAILIAAYLKRRKIPFRLIASSKKANRRIHHVFPQMNIGGQWHNVDVTYTHYRPLERKFVTRAEVLQS